MKVCIILPTYNERENVKRLVPLIFGLDITSLHVLVVDDSSPDGTADEIKSMQNKFHNLHLLVRKSKEGIGAAYIAGFRYAFEKLTPDIIIQMDSDLSHNPDDIPRLIKTLDEGAELVIGSRYVPGGKIVGWNLWRKIVSGGGNTFAHVLVRLPMRDCTAGFRAWLVPSLKKIDLNKLNVLGYAFLLNMLWEVKREGLLVKEIPVTFTERTIGKSKLGIRDMFEFFLTSIRLAFRSSRKL